MWNSEMIKKVGLLGLLDMRLQTDGDNPYMALYIDHPYFAEVCAGAKHHHWWKGGLEQHVVELICFMADQLIASPEAYMGVTLNDCIIVALLHDFDKIWAYVPLSQDDISMREEGSTKYHAEQVFKSSYKEFTQLDGVSKTLRLLSSRGITPTESQWSALLFAHGGYSNANFGFGGITYTGDKVMHANPLAVLLHLADMFSANLLSKELA
jgi:hypothetical protein